MHPSVGLFAPVPKIVEFREQRAFGELPFGACRVVQRWTPSKSFGESAYEVVEAQLGPQGEQVRETTIVAFGDQGLVTLGVVGRDGTFDRWTPVQVVLPAFPSAGAAWSAVHERKGVVCERSCEVLPSTRFAGGVVVVADSKLTTSTGSARVVLREHYAPGIGWAGFEAMLVRPQGTMRVWSEGVVRDGVAVPEPPESEESP